MRAMLGMAIGAVLALTAGGALADEVTGTVQNIDLTRMTFEVEGKTFTASPTNTVGVKLDELQEGDKITVEATDIQTGKQPINAMSLKKVE
jgi:ABC-type glycerol-3-phosphate transport system substrate-binding protein